MGLPAEVLVSMRAYVSQAVLESWHTNNGNSKESAKRKSVVNAIAKGWMCSDLTKRISAAAFNVRTEEHTVLERLHGQCWGDEELPQQIDFDEYVC